LHDAADTSERKKPPLLNFGKLGKKRACARVFLDGWIGTHRSEANLTIESRLKMDVPAAIQRMGLLVLAPANSGMYIMRWIPSLLVVS
jgi:hypothetical protein